MTERVVKAIEYFSLPQFVYKEKEDSEWKNYLADSVYLPLINPISWAKDINKTAVERLLATNEELFTYFLLGNRALDIFLQTGTVDTLILTLGLNEKEIRLFENLYTRIRLDPQERDQIIYESISEREEFKAHYLSEVQEYKALETSIPWSITSFTETSKSAVYSAQINNNLLGIFNHIVPTEDVPLLSTSMYYKKLKEYMGIIEYPDEPNILFVYIDGIRITIKDVTTSFVNPMYEITMMENAVIYKKLLALLAPREIHLQEHVLNGSFSLLPIAVEPIDFNKTVLSDIVMNNAIFSDEFAIDEHIRATKYQSTLYITWFHEADKIAVTLASYAQLNPITNKMDYGVVARVSNISQRRNLIEKLAARIATLLGYYQTMAPIIAAEYNMLLSQPIDLSIKKTDKPLQLKHIATDLFPQGYSRACQFKPRIVTDTEEAKNIEEKFQVMFFPKDVPNPFLFACDQHEQHVYPGLRINHLANKAQYPYLPCCYKQDQRKKSSNYMAYYGDAPVTIPAPVQATRFLITDKIVKFNQTGKLPQKLEDFFKLVGSPRAIRRGVPRSPSSILDCILCYTKDKFKEKTEQERLKFIGTIRNVFGKSASEVNLLLCKQETWNLTTEQVKNILSESTKFIDASLFFAFLEQTFQCRLVVFTKDDFKPPYYNHGYIHHPTSGTWPIVILYENIGGEAQHAEYPQYELVENIQNTQAIYDLYLQSFVNYTIYNGQAIELQYVDIPSTFKTDIKEQFIDAYGKVYALNVRTTEYKDDVTFFLDLPIAPLKKPLATRVYYTHYGPYKGVLNVNGQNISGIFKQDESKQSVLEDYIFIRKQVKLMMENAKYIKSIRDAIQYKINPQKVTYSDKQWMSNKKLVIPNELLSEKLNFGLKVFGNHHKEILNDYKNLSYIPYKYENILDFNKDSKYIVAESGHYLPQESNTYIRPNMTSFFVKIGIQLYFCNVLPSLPSDIPFTLYVYETQTILKSESNLDILLYDKQYYKMDKV